MAVEDDVVGSRSDFGSQIDGLWDVGHSSDGEAIGHSLSQFDNGLFAHTVYNQVCGCVAENARAQLVLPIVVVRQSAQRGFYASQNDWNVGIELAKYLGIDDGGIFRPHVVPAVRTVGIFRAQAAVGSILVDH